MTRSVRALVRAWGPATLWLAVLFYLSHQTWDDAPGWLNLPDKLVHLGLYAVLGLTLAWGARAWGGPGPLALGIFGLAWAISDEWHQSFIPGRFPSTGDIVADMAGLLLGGAFAVFAFRILPSPTSGGPTTPIDAPS